MPLPDPSLEPAIRDPKKLRNTAFLLIAIMILGGSLILIAYEKWSKSKASDDRPAVIYRITPERDLRMLRQDGKTVDLVDLRQQVIALNVISTRNPQVAELSMAVMKRLAAARATEPHFNLVTLVLDPAPVDELLPNLEKTSQASGMTLPQWWCGSNEPATLHKFIKNELKASLYPNEKNGKWEYDSSIVLIDKNGHIRRGVVHQKQGGPPFVATFDFEQAASWDARGVKTGTDLTNAAQLEKLLDQTIDRLLLEPYVSNTKQDTTTLVLLIVFVTGILLFLLALKIRNLRLATR
jgi:cytochrome oxidase Cu insertion factor (SCO1/SenC/PrrC family)